jgi:predicted Zn-dependent protease
LTIEQMKQMADAQASSLIEKSKAEPKNAGLLVQIAGIYQACTSSGEAVGYFEKALSIDPKNVLARTEMASCLYCFRRRQRCGGAVESSAEVQPKGRKRAL